MSARAALSAVAIAMLTTLAFPALATGQMSSAVDAAVRSQEHANHQVPQEKPEQPSQPPPADLPPITDEDRKAAFPELAGQHTIHDHGLHSYVLFDQLEWRAGDGASGPSWDSKGWIGGDVSRFWFRAEGEAADGDLEEAAAHALYGRAVARWWDLVVGIRQDVRPGPARTWAVAGIQGLAPYWFEVEATAYFGESGRTHVRLESEYELFLTNRLILQPLIEVDIYGKADQGSGIGAGLSSMTSGLRLRYEVRREFAPYVGVSWDRKFFGTADLAKAEGEDPGGTRLVTGARIWF